MPDASLPPQLQEHRTLAAIVFTDGVSFSARMSEDEERTLQLIRRDLQLMSELCQRFEGHVLKTTGDGLLMYFTSAVSAVACALEIQKQLSEMAAHLPAKDVLLHRVGIHLGDVFFSEDDVMGNGVNIAARLQTLAEPGGICLSQTVYDVVKGGLPLEATYLGPRELKNIREAVPVYQILLTPQLAAHGKAQVPAAPLSKQEYRDRQILLNKVKNYWIKGVLETSLHGRALIELGLEERFDALDRPWNAIWESSDAPGQPLSPGTKLIDKFDDLGAGRTLLILGEPGAGKTTTLLELTRDLIASAERHIAQPVPVVFNLSSWGSEKRSEKQSIASWLVEEMYAKYQVSKEIGRVWIKEQQLLLLLDGLDEVSAERRDACVQAINQFMQEYGQTEIVVCCRIKDYKALSTRLRFQGAIYLQPLSDEQIDKYLMSGGAELAALRTALQADATLQEIAKSPLMLNIMAIAYQGISFAELPPENLEERRRHLFDTYIDRMFKRRGSDRRYSKEQAKRWLIWLAQRMVQQSETVFLIEGLQYRWLPSKREKWLYALGVGALGGLSGGLSGGLRGYLIHGWPVGLIYGVILGLSAWLITGLIWGLIATQINPVETLKWSWQKARNNLMLGMRVGLGFGMILGLGNGLIARLVHGQTTWLINSLLYGLNYAVCIALIFILLRGLNGPGIEMRTIPNQGIWQSAKHAMAFSLIGMIGVGTGCWLMGLPIFLGMMLGLLFGLFGTGEACLKHFTLRFILYYGGCVPWNYARFLDYATGLIFLQKVGGGYIFIHRLLLEHFAAMKFK